MYAAMQRLRCVHAQLVALIKNVLFPHRNMYLTLSGAAQGKRTWAGVSLLDNSMANNRDISYQSSSCLSIIANKKLFILQDAQLEKL